MQIGLLQCDHISEQFQHLIRDYPDMFYDLFAKHAPDISLKVYDVCHGELPQAVDECEGYITTGSRQSVYDDIEWIHRLADFVRRVDAHQQKLVGICFGHQMIAHALGGRVAKSANGWGVGIKTVALQTTKPWMKPDSTSYQLILSHQDQVLEIPQDAEVLAGNAHCPIAMFAVGNHILGIQAHPEFTPEYAGALMDSRVERIGVEVVQRAKDTLSTPTSEEQVVQWIRAFLASA